MLKNDIWINQKANEGMLDPFQPSLIRHLDPKDKTNDKESDKMNSTQDEAVLGEEVSTESGLKYIDNVILKYLIFRTQRN